MVRFIAIGLAALMGCGSPSSVDGGAPLGGNGGGSSSGGAAAGGIAGGGGAAGGNAAGGNAAGGNAAGGNAAGGVAGGNGSDGGSEWSPLTVMPVTNLVQFGAAGDGGHDDTPAFTSAINALGTSGGIVYLPPGKTFRKNDLLTISSSHVKFWSPNRQATIFQSIGGLRRHQSMLCRNNQGCGFFGVKFRSDATARFDALEDNQISADHTNLVEVVGCEIDGSAASGIFLYGSTEHYIEGNFIHHTWADHVHHTSAARDSWCWNNFIFNEAPSRGDDGIACVTYGPTSPRCGRMEWWNNTILQTGWGRGYSVIGGDDIDIHHNWAMRVAGAGLIVASEPSYDSASSSRITMRNNSVYRCATAIGHPGILISGMHPDAGAIDRVTLRDNASVETVTGQPFRVEGTVTNLVDVGLSTDAGALLGPLPTQASIRVRDTSILKTRDVSHVVQASQRVGLFRIHVRGQPGAFEQRFEYLVKGTGTLTGMPFGGRVVGQVTSAGQTYVLIYSPQPFVVPSGFTAVTWSELRSGANDGRLSALWQLVDG